MTVLMKFCVVFLLVVLTVILECFTTICRYELMHNCWNTSLRQRPIFTDIIEQLKSLARLYDSDDDIGIPTSDSGFFIKQPH